MAVTKYLAIVPAYNESASITMVVKSLLALPLGLDVLVVNDGSKDDTAKLAAAAGAKVVTLPCNMGIGGAVQTGFIYARNNGYDVAFQVDGDGQHNADDIQTIVEPILYDVTDVAIGSRFLSLKSFRSSGTRRLGITIFKTVIYMMTGQKITDSTSGFRAFSPKAIAYLADHYPCDYPEVEAVVALKRNGFRIKEFSVRMKERQGGKSSITPIKSVYYMIKVLLALVISFLRPPEKPVSKC